MSGSHAFLVEDGFQFETLLSKHRILATSEISFGVRIRNQTSTQQQFLLFWLQPIFFRKNANCEWEHVRHLGSSANGTSLATIWDCQVIAPGESIDFMMKGKFGLIQGSSNIWFSYQDKGRGVHSWKEFQPGTHGLQCKYDTLKLERYLDYYARNSLAPGRWVGMENSWVGKVTTPLVEFQLCRESENIYQNGRRH